MNNQELASQSRDLSDASSGFDPDGYKHREDVSTSGVALLQVPGEVASASALVETDPSRKQSYKAL